MKKFLLLCVVVFSGCTLLVSCKSTGSPSTSDSSKNSMAFDTTAAKKAVAAGNQLIIESIAKGDSVTAANCYTTDAKFMDSNSPAVVGRKNIQAAFSGFIKGGVTKLGITTINVWGMRGYFSGRRHIYDSHKGRAPGG